MRFSLPSSETSKIFKTKLEEKSFEIVLEQVDKEKSHLFHDDAQKCQFPLS